jgi:HSP20 family protein
MSPETSMAEKRAARRGEEVEATRAQPTYLPRTDIYEREDAIVVVTEMPGVSRDGVDVDVDRNELTIIGHPDETSIEGHELSYAEYEVGDYQRKFRISGAIDADKIDARMKNGVLQVTFPKAKEAQPQKISVKAG